MSEIDAKVNMSLDEIIKMEKKEKKKKSGTTSGKAGAKRTRGSPRGRNGLRGRGRGARIKRNVGIVKKDQTWQAGQNNNNNNNNINVRGGFVRKRYKKNTGLTRSRSNLTLNQKSNIRGVFNTRRARGNRFGLTRSRSRTNLTFTQGGFFTNNKATLKKTNSLPNLRDPTSVHNRLGYQSPAQVAYRNRVKKAKQLLLQKQNQRLSLQNQFRQASQAGKSVMSVQQRSAGRRQQILTSQRRFTTGGLRSDQIARAQRRVQYEQKLMRMNTARLNPSANVNCMCKLGNEYSPSKHPRPLNFTPNQNGNTPDGMGDIYQQCKRLSVNIKYKRPLSPISETDDYRMFSQIIHRISGSHTNSTLNDRFSY
ncbi:probable serine/threonine-protein kinase cdc7 [Ceratina calcarata]|uniref:Probable serine/threonine-protein kinase cdc7 n=1 Tax=Ceratina calcarata TaxID=156304 RepID=A0AAJ7JBR1_9HYME|nr:probable serine/threonine-protein kinase cdc7 [Ceratina calcarata]